VRYPSRGPSGWEVLIFVGLVLVVVLAWAQIIHGDLRCAFADCRIVTK
jgi:hypothetical protein